MMTRNAENENVRKKRISYFFHVWNDFHVHVTFDHTCLCDACLFKIDLKKYKFTDQQRYLNYLNCFSHFNLRHIYLYALNHVSPNYHDLLHVIHDVHYHDDDYQKRHDHVHDRGLRNHDQIHGLRRDVHGHRTHDPRALVE